MAGRVHGAAEQVRTCLDEIYMSVGKMEGAYNGVHKRAKRLLQEVERLNLAGTPPSTRPHSSPPSNCMYHPGILIQSCCLFSNVCCEHAACSTGTFSTSLCCLGHGARAQGRTPSIVLGMTRKARCEWSHRYNCKGRRGRADARAGS